VSILALYSIKGGVGKTTTCVNLAHLAAEQGSRVILVDLDPQASASFYLRIRGRKGFKGRQLVQGGKRLTKQVRGTDYSRLDAVPAKLSYRKLDVALDGMRDSRRRLARAIKPLAKDYRYVFLDCPPSITMIAENVFDAAHLLVVPTIPTTLSMLTYEKLLAFFRARKLDHSKIVAFFSMVEKRKRLHRQIIDESRGKDRHFLRNLIPYAASVERMGVYREPITAFDRRCKASEAYRRLWDEIRAGLE
jgi:cellulose biosynthesis protein BcsQ